MFEGFETHEVDTGEASIHAVVGGSGPPLLLLHGNPQTHVMWHLVAPRLAEEFTVVAPDLRGYGDSSKPETTEDHEPYSKRAMARDQVAVMEHFGFESFAVCGHDRGGRVAYRMALDSPERVTKLAVLDIVPTGEAFGRADMSFGLGYWHWFFLAQPFDLPERAIEAAPDLFLERNPTGSWTPEAREEYRRCFRNPATVHAICEDYRAAATLDLAHDREDRRAGKRIPCPVLALWGRRGYLERWYDVSGVWGDWTDSVTGRSLDCGHYLAEEAPDGTYGELRAFLGSTL